MNDYQIDWRETVETLLARSKRSFVPIDKSFVQLPRGNEERNSVLARFIRNGDLRGLKAYLLIAASTSSSDENGEWYTTLPLQTCKGVRMLSACRNRFRKSCSHEDTLPPAATETNQAGTIRLRPRGQGASSVPGWVWRTLSEASATVSAPVI